MERVAMDIYPHSNRMILLNIYLFRKMLVFLLLRTTKPSKEKVRDVTTRALDLFDLEEV